MDGLQYFAFITQCLLALSFPLWIEAFSHCWSPITRLMTVHYQSITIRILLQPANPFQSKQNLELDLARNWFGLVLRLFYSVRRNRPEGHQFKTQLKYFETINFIWQVTLIKNYIFLYKYEKPHLKYLERRHLGEPAYSKSDESISLKICTIIFAKAYWCLICSIFVAGCWIFVWLFAVVGWMVVSRLVCRFESPPTTSPMTDWGRRF